jgi:hypothetical protein
MRLPPPGGVQLDEKNNQNCGVDMTAKQLKCPKKFEGAKCLETRHAAGEMTPSKALKKI